MFAADYGQSVYRSCCLSQIGTRFLFGYKCNRLLLLTTTALREAFLQGHGGLNKCGQASLLGTLPPMFPLSGEPGGGGRAPPDSCSHRLLTSQMKLHRGQQAVKVASCIGVTGYATVDSAF